MRFLTMYDGEVSEPLVGRQGSRVSMRVARGSICLRPVNDTTPQDAAIKAAAAVAAIGLRNLFINDSMVLCVLW